MQMIAAGGIEPLTDGQRVADEDNPHGYLELEAVKGTRSDPTWVGDARGKVVKVISHLLDQLPRDETYRIVFVDRDLEEVLASQQKMIQRRGGRSPDEALVRRAFENHLGSFDHLQTARSDWSVLRIDYSAIVSAPVAAAERIASFLGLPSGDDRSCIEAMAAAVDPTLYRNRSAP